MSRLLLGSVALAYLYVAVGYWRDDRRGMCLAFVAYALANVGLLIDYGRKGS